MSLYRTVNTGSCCEEHGGVKVEKYCAWMPKETRNDVSAVMRAYKSVRGGKEMIVDKSKGDSEFRICLVRPPATVIPD